MSDSPCVNRYLEDRMMDHIDHALGRPVDPMGRTYRNYFATEEDMFSDNPHWFLARIVGDMRFYSVSVAGRKALADYLISIGDEHRAYVVSVDGVDMSPIAAKSHGNARYMAWLLLDGYCDSFGDFQRMSRVRLS